MKQETLDKWVYRKTEEIDEITRELGRYFYLEETGEGFRYVPKNKKAMEIYEKLKKIMGEEGRVLLLLAQPYMEKKK